MDEFPDFMKNRRNAIDPKSQSPGVEGYVYDGADGSQMAHWICRKDGISKEHTHGYDEYFVVVQGKYTLIIGAKRITLETGQEYLIPKGVPHGGEFAAGTRTIHAFGGRRAERVRL
jgi:quercetin dioxygenase-like cupin family protein